jgi:hypothetical protein
VPEIKEKNLDIKIEYLSKSEENIEDPLETRKNLKLINETGKTQSYKSYNFKVERSSDNRFIYIKTDYSKKECEEI